MFSSSGAKSDRTIWPAEFRLQCSAGIRRSPGSRETRHRQNDPDLRETLEWLTRASMQSGFVRAGSIIDEIHTEIQSSGDSCSVTMIETRPEAAPSFREKLTFSLSDIDPTDIYVTDLAKPDPDEPELSKLRAKINKGRFSVTFHTTNYTKKLMTEYTDPENGKPFGVQQYIMFTNDWFAPRFAKALKHAIELCKGRKSTYD